MDEIPFDMFTFLGSTRLQCFETQTKRETNTKKGETEIRSHPVKDTKRYNS